MDSELREAIERVLSDDGIDLSDHETLVEAIIEIAASAKATLIRDKTTYQSTTGNYGLGITEAPDGQ